jgi:16S rRNA (guanine1207-N2)-methyltransferase
VAPGGVIAVDGQKTDGIDTALKELRARVDLSESLSKAHGKLASFNAGPDLSDWLARPAVVDGFQTLPGVFSADGPDRGSVLLAKALPIKLSGKVADLGAGWGYLSRAILERPGVKRLDLVEAEAEALDCARANITDPRARFHWADATSFRPETLLDAVVMNPPFHVGRDADPGLGAAFIRAARRMLAPNGSLWLVANRHLPYDGALSEHFLLHEEVAGDGGFRVIHALKPKRAKP